MRARRKRRGESSLEMLTMTGKQTGQSPGTAQIGHPAVQIRATVRAAKSLVSGLSPRCGG